MNSFELCLFDFDMAIGGSLVELIVRLSVVSLKVGHSLLMLLHIEVAIFAEIIIAVFVAHVLACNKCSLQSQLRGEF